MKLNISTIFSNLIAIDVDWALISVTCYSHTSVIVTGCMHYAK